MSVTTPTMMPAVAQVVAAVSTWIEPSRSVLTNRLGVIAVSRVRKLKPTLARWTRTPRDSRSPNSMNTMIEISDRKWKP